MTNTYAHIINKSRPVSKRPHMSLDNRAKIFAPFSALRGFDISILTKEKDRALVPRVTLSEHMQETIERKLRKIKSGEQIALTWFRPVKQIGGNELGEYVTETLTATWVDCQNRVLVTKERTVPFEDIREIIVEACEVWEDDQSESA